MEFYDVISRRRTIRDFTDEKIDADTLRRIIGAGLKAPTNDHLRDWHFIAVTDKAVVSRILEQIPRTMSDGQVMSIIDEWKLRDASQRRMYQDAIPKQYRMLSEASCLLIPLYREKGDLTRPKNLSALNAFASIWCCIENILLASAAEGYACALRIPLNTEPECVRAVLHYPEGYVMPCFLAIGRQKPDAKYNDQNPCPVEERIHMNAW